MSVTEIADPLVSAPASPDRVAYAVGMLLNADDFQAEQVYHRGQLARALRYLFGAGTIAGLAVTADPAAPPAQPEEEIHVAPGLALDRIGRLIEIPRRSCIRVGRWLTAGGNDLRALASGDILRADLFLRFVACERGKTPAFATGPFDVTDAVKPSRLRDGFELNMFARASGDPRPADDNWAPLRNEPEATRPARLPQTIYDSWSSTELARPASYPPKADATAIYLARLDIPLMPDDPIRRSVQPITVSDAGRPFALPAPALLALSGIALP